LFAIGEFASRQAAARQAARPDEQPQDQEISWTSGNTLPAGRFAVMTHTGAPPTLVAATAALLEWAAESGLRWDVSPTDAGEKWGGRLEFYLTNPADQPDTSQWQTKLAFRLAE
jgi:effector-binding domain-containing protein